MSGSLVTVPEMSRTFADIAVELRLGEQEACFKRVSFALQLDCFTKQIMRDNLFLLSDRVGLSRPIAAAVVDEWTVRAHLIGEGHKIFKALIPHERIVRRLAGVE